METRLLPTIHLIGDSEENFYRLGRKDRDSYKPLITNMGSLLRTPWKGVDSSLHKLCEQLITNLQMGKDLNFKKHLSAYAEGLETSFEKIAVPFLLPELLSSLNSWLPSLSNQLMACTSSFMIDEKTKSPVHLRFLDFPFLGSFDLNERILITEFTHEQRIISFGTSGLPYPSLSCMNEAGVTLALHQKFSDILNLKGRPIFELTREMMGQVKTPEDVLRFFKGKESISCWGLYMLFKSGEVLAVDLLGKKIQHQRYELKKKKILTFNNLLIKKPEEQKQIAPYHFFDYCQERIENENRKNKELELFTEEELLKTMSTPLIHPQKHLKNWKADCITPMTLSALTMNPEKQSALIVPSEGPKYYQGNLIQFIFSKKQKILSEEKENIHEDFKEGMRRLILGAQAHHAHNPHQAYHEMQMACEYLEKYPEKKLAKLFYLFYRFIYENENAQREAIYKELVPLKNDLPPYLKDQCLLFIWRLEKLLGRKSKITEKDFSNAYVKKLFLIEKKIPKMIFHKMTASFISPHPEIQDILYSSILKP